MNPIKKYAKFVSHYPAVLLIIVIILTSVAFVFSSKVGTVASDNADSLPDNIDVIEAFDIIEDNFGGSDSIMISIELDPDYRGSNEIRDIRDPDVILYTSVLSEFVLRTDDVVSVSSAGDTIKEINDGIIPKNKQDIAEIISDNTELYNYINEEYTMSIIQIRLNDEYDLRQLISDLNNAIEQVPKPSGLNVNVAGDIATDTIIEDSIGPDMERTSRFSMIGILIVLFLLFLSVRYALIPLLVIGVGILWAFGFFGIQGMNLSSVTSGAISMIMGIGIDFGIQTISRFRQELKTHNPNRAMENTISNVFMPMFTTTMAALIGFRAMSMGELTFMKELGTIMSYGVTFCFLATITVVPVIAIYSEKLIIKIKKYIGGKIK